MYSKYIVPENYSGVRFKAPIIETETKLHKPTPSYTSTRTSVSPTFQNAINARIAKEKEDKISEDVADFDKNNLSLPRGEEDYSDNDELSSSFSFEADNTVADNEEEIIDVTSKEEYKNDEKKAGIGLFGKEFLPILSKITSKISTEDLLLLSLILVFASEENGEAKDLLLPLLLLFLYN